MLMNTLLFALLALGSGGQHNEGGTVMSFSSQDGDGNSVLIKSLNIPDRFKVEINGEELEIDGSALGVGDSQSITLGDGREMKVIREESGMVLNLDGKLINLARNMWAAGDGAPAIMELLKSAADPDAVTISGLGDIDEATKQKIIDALHDAGVDKEVKFGGNHQTVFFQSGHGAQSESKVIQDRQVKIYRFDSTDGDAHVKVETHVGGEPVIVIEEKDGKKEEKQ